MTDNDARRWQTCEQCGSRWKEAGDPNGCPKCRQKASVGAVKRGSVAFSLLIFFALLVISYLLVTGALF